MDGIRSVTITFCVTCICAEIVMQLIDDGWSRRVIKGVCGLYILVVLFRTIDGSVVQAPQIALPAAASVSFGDSQELILKKTGEQLAANLQDRCQEKFGVIPRIQIELDYMGQTVVVRQVDLTLPDEVPEGVQKEITDFLCQTLNCAPNGGDDI